MRFGAGTMRLNMEDPGGWVEGELPHGTGGLQTFLGALDWASGRLNLVLALWPGFLYTRGQTIPCPASTPLGSVC